MKKHIITITLITLNYLSYAQGSFFVALQGNIGKTALLNKEDKEAGQKLMYKNTYKINYGLLLGYKLHNNIGLRSINTGISYNTIVQKYTGSLVTMGFTKCRAETKLKYMKIPIDFTFAFVKEDRFIPIALIGFHVNYLRNYSDNFYASFNPIADEENYFIIVDKEKSYIKNERYGLHDMNIIDKGYYQTWAYGATAGVGAEVIISDKFSASLIFKGDYGISDAEYKGKIKYSSYPVPMSPWEQFHAKYYTRGSLVGSEANPGPRPKTHSMNLGLQLALFFHLDGGLLNFKNKNL